MYINLKGPLDRQEFKSENLGGGGFFFSGARSKLDMRNNSNRLRKHSVEVVRLNFQGCFPFSKNIIAKTRLGYFHSDDVSHCNVCG